MDSADLKKLADLLDAEANNTRGIPSSKDYEKAGVDAAALTLHGIANALYKLAKNS